MRFVIECSQGRSSRRGSYQHIFFFFFLRMRPPPSSTLFPYTTLFRSSRTCNDHLFTDFWKFLQINARAEIDSSRDKNIRAPASMTAQGHTDDGVVGVPLSGHAGG